MVQVDEVAIEDRADATQMARELKRASYFPAVVVPDATGRQSQGGKSSIRMLRDEGFYVHAPLKNPPTIDRKNAVNALFMNAANQIKLYIDPRCTNTVRALQAQKMDKHGRPEKDNVHDHYTDAFGYPIHSLYPAAIPREPRRNRKALSNGD
jgi:hypothetical protein